MAGSDGFLTNFKTGVEGNFARAYLFYARIVNAPIEIPESQKYLVRSTSMPESTIEAIEVPFQGMVYKMGSTHTFSEWECTFNADNGMKLRQAFVNWQTAVHDPKTNTHGNPEDYFGQIEIEMLTPFQDFSGTDSTGTYKSTLFNAWPSSVGAIDLAYDSKDVAQFSVTFTYNWHTEETL